MKIKTEHINDMEEIEKLVKETRNRMLALRDETITIEELSYIMTVLAKNMADMIHANPNKEVNSYMLILSYMQSVFATFVEMLENRRKNSNA